MSDPLTVLTGLCSIIVNIVAHDSGDSWRPRVSFLPELQINLFTGAIKIDFGGVDRWDFRERQRNIAEAEATLHMS